MVFNSFSFALFFLIFIVIYFASPQKIRKPILLGFSVFFYGYWDYRFLSLLLFSVLFDYFIGIAINDAKDHKQKKKLLVFAITVSLTLLGIFKYFNFFIDNISFIAHSLFDVDFKNTFKIILPIGISFYTFHSISYVVDIYKGKIQASRNLLNYSLFILFFPQLVAGPIARATHLLPQFSRPAETTKRLIYSGIWLIIWGYFKKIYVADSIAPMADMVFSAQGAMSGLDVYLASIIFAIQIYCDFSGYTDIARGLANIMGYDLTLNFNFPLYSKSPVEYWERWHISLSSFLKDYLYIPLGGNRGGIIKTGRNILITMTLGGLWHGASWTYVLWGLFHALWLLAYRLYQKTGLSRFSNNVLNWFVCTQLLIITYFLFRSESFHKIASMVKDLRKWSYTTTSESLVYAILLYILPFIILEGFVYFASKSQHIKSRVYIHGCIAALALILIFAFGDKASEFIYFQF